ncbi:MAG TPA: 6-bladed beta-propeller, partial [Rhodocyclaceae bacterium]
MAANRTLDRRQFLRSAGSGLGLAALAGCATAPPPTLQLQPPNGGGRKFVWPPPPEVPRFLYAGELTGEANFARQETLGDGVVGALKWFVGLVVGEAPPLVMQRPQAGVVDERGRIFVTDVSRQAVFVFDEKEGQLLLWDMASSTRHFSAPVGIAVGLGGQILVSDAELGIVVKLLPDGTPLGSFGQDKLKRPTGLARDPVRGLVYVADTRAHDIKVFDDQDRLVNVIGHSGDDDGELNAPTHLTFAGGRLYVTDSLNSRIQVYAENGEWERHFGARGLYVGNLVRPKGVAVDNEGHV